MIFELINFAEVEIIISSSHEFLGAFWSFRGERK